MTTVTSEKIIPDNTTIILTRVPLAFPPLAERVRDWSDRDAMHRAVMTLFDPQLPGDAGLRRAASSILFRVEGDQRNPYLLIQSHVALASMSDSLVTTDLSGLIPRLAPGTVVMFRIDINAVRCQSRSTRRLPIPEPEIPEWLTGTTMSRGLSEIAVDDLKVRVLRAGRTPLRIARIDGNAVVRDQGALVALLDEGVGRAKAYGCGLLSVLPIG
ncbi:type I-E CRISPR-associated protein Cas6/Cse3/CasE [Acidithrix sp. C25]|uniref:type I-E CRISPR-associated protein Cas6/Cse3/CasE n=1 Tax=Acidithrix sp. C25 TaxID=1671482 RepID=UPI00191BAD49|nr:type I-E CRISPR-associated protein Cas6/Cse3/CasE [Acidithrix sp. C25]